MLKDPAGVCPVCKLPIMECICCPERGHVCPLDQGDSYCPVCSPDPVSTARHEDEA